MFRWTSRVSLLLTYLGACTLEVPGAGPAQSLDPTPIMGSDAHTDPTNMSPDAGARPPGADAGWPAASAGGGAGTQGGAPAQADAAVSNFEPGSSASADGGAADLRDAGATPLILTSSAFRAGERLPDEHSCLGSGSSPALSWSGGPAATQSYAVALIARTESIVSLPRTANWVVWDVQALALPEDVPPGAQPASVPGAHQASRVTDPRALFIGPQYQAPCAILGGQQFELILYALAVASLPVDAQASPDEIVQQIESGGALLATSRLAFTFP